MIKLGKSRYWIESPDIDKQLDDLVNGCQTTKSSCRYCGYRLFYSQRQSGVGMCAPCQRFSENNLILHLDTLDQEPAWSPYQ